MLVVAQLFFWLSRPFPFFLVVSRPFPFFLVVASFLFGCGKRKNQEFKNQKKLKKQKKTNPKIQKNAKDSNVVQKFTQ